MAGLPEKFYIPWKQVDPALQHGGIPGGLEGFVAPDLGDNPSTLNRTLVDIFYNLSMGVASVSMHPQADVEGFPGRSLVEEALKCVQSFAQEVIVHTHTYATKFFYHTHCIPPTEHFMLNGIRYRLRNQFADKFTYYGLATLVELAENNRNGAHKGLDPKSSERLLAGLYDWKSDVMKFYFGIEVAGEISSRELNTLFETINTPNPFYPDESAEVPDDDDVANALTGVDVLKWIPGSPNWAMFDQLERQRYTPERVFQPEETDQTTEDVRTGRPHQAADTSTGGPTV